MEDHNSLSRFLKQNQPLPPQAPSRELDQILARVNGRKRHVVWPWAAAIAASLVLIMLWLGPARDTNNLADLDMGYESFPTLEVGEDYLEIVAAD